MKKKRMASVESLEKEIYEKRQDVRYDIRDMTVEAIVNKYYDGLPDDDKEKDIYNYIFIPEYQRDFTWDENRQSKFIESIIIGLPTPFLFVAENKDSSWEIVDGSQRIRTLYSFVKGKLVLQGLQTIKRLNGFAFENLEIGRRGKFLNSALRIIVLSEETTDEVKKDMFERINRGSDLLKPMEKRKGIYPGKLTDLIYDYCENNERFIKLTAVDRWLERRQEREELLLRFFALTDTNAYENGIKEGISLFLDDYLDKKNSELNGCTEEERQERLDEYKDRIERVSKYVDINFPYGFRHKQNPQTKRSVFEAISVGVWKALSEGTAQKKLDKNRVGQVLASSEFRQYTYIANELHRKQKLRGRVMTIYNVVTGKEEYD